MEQEQAVQGTIDLSPLLQPFITKLEAERLAFKKVLDEARQELVEIADKSPRLLDDAAAAEYIGRSKAYLRLSRMNGRSEPRRKDGSVRHVTPAPPYIRLDDKVIRYRRSDLDKWIRDLKAIQP